MSAFTICIKWHKLTDYEVGRGWLELPPEIRHARRDEAMQAQLERLTYKIELGHGEKLSLPTSLIDSVGAGCWTITIQSAESAAEPTRDHSAFLESYSPADEGLYDDCPGR